MLRQVAYVAAHVHVLHLRIALLKLTAFLLLRNQLTPLHLYRAHVLCQHLLHVVRYDIKPEHVFVRGQRVREVQIRLFVRALQAHGQHRVFLYRLKVQVLCRYDAVVRRDQRKRQVRLLACEQVQVVDRVAVGFVLLQLRTVQTSAASGERQAYTLVL